MTNKYLVRYLPVAVDDLVSIFDWIAHDSTANAAAFIDKLDQRIGNLKTHPFFGHIPKDDKLKNFGYRVLVIEPYLVFYTQDAHNLRFINLIQSDHELTGWHGQAGLVRVFAILLTAIAPAIVSLGLSIQIAKWIIHKQCHSSSTRINGVYPCRPIYQFKYSLIVNPLSISCLIVSSI